MPICSSLFRLLTTSKTFLGAPIFLVLDVTYNQHIKHVPFNFTCHTILAILDHSGRQTEFFKLPIREIYQGGKEMIKPFDILRKSQRFTLLRDACDQNIDSKIAMFLF